MPGVVDLLGIGNAIVDVLAPVDFGFLAEHDLHPGTMALVDAARAAALTHAFHAGTTGRVELRGGGSAANTCVAAAALGASVAYLGKIADDALGRAFADDLARLGIRFPTRPLRDGPATASCAIAVTPDGQRTMSTFLGAANLFSPADLDPVLIGSARFTYLEGYLFDPPAAQDAFREAAAIAHAAGRKVALSLSDPFCVDRHREGFRAFVRDHADIVFGNEHELEALYGVPFDEALAALAAETAIAVGTRSAAGSVLQAGGERVAVAAHPTFVVDTTGAGDAYAAGVLAALAAGRPLAEAGALGSLAAGAVIAHVGARPEADLGALARAAGLA